MADEEPRWTKQLWAPWRLEYIERAGEEQDCVFCRAQALGDDDGLIVHRGSLAFVVLNKFPYAPGHLMVAPNRHVGDLGKLSDDEAIEIHRLSTTALGVLMESMRPQGFNLGWNLGRV